jgi:hypothetical protein
MHQDVAPWPSNRRHSSLPPTRAAINALAVVSTNGKKGLAYLARGGDANLCGAQVSGYENCRAESLDELRSARRVAVLEAGRARWFVSAAGNRQRKPNQASEDGTAPYRP